MPTGENVESRMRGRRNELFDRGSFACFFFFYDQPVSLSDQKLCDERIIQISDIALILNRTT